MIMKKLYVDMTKNNSCSSIFMKDTEIIRAGVTIYSMPVTDRNSEYQKFANDYDIHYIFDDDDVFVDFYTIPYVDILATDSEGGYICTVGEMSDLDSEAPICYIDKNKKAFFIAENFKTFLEKVDGWKKSLVPYDEITFFSSKEEAEQEYEFFELDKVVESLMKEGEESPK